MKKLNVFLLIVLLLMIAFVVYFFAGGALRVESSVITAPAAEHAEAFASIRSVLSSNAAPQRFADALPESAEGLTLVDVTLTLSNPGLFPAEWLDLTVFPAARRRGRLLPHRRGRRRARPVDGHRQPQAPHRRRQREPDGDHSVLRVRPDAHGDGSRIICPMESAGVSSCRAFRKNPL